MYPRVLLMLRNAFNPDNEVSGVLCPPAPPPRSPCAALCPHPCAPCLARLAMSDAAFLTFRDCAAHGDVTAGAAPGTVLALPDVTIAPGDALRIPVYVRGAFTGDHTLRLAVAYSDDARTAFRVCHRQVRLQIRPCLQLRAFCLHASPVRRGGAAAGSAPYLMALEIHNCRPAARAAAGRAAAPDTSAALVQLTAVARDWGAVPINLPLLPRAQLLRLYGNQSLVLFFRLERLLPGGPTAHAPLISLLPALRDEAPAHYAALRTLLPAPAAAAGADKTASADAAEGAAAEGAAEGEGAAAAEDGPIDTLQWPFGHFILNTATSPASSLKSTPVVSPLQPAAPLPALQPPPPRPLSFICHWATHEKGSVGETQLTTVPYDWNKGWTGTAVDLHDSLKVDPPPPSLPALSRNPTSPPLPSPRLTLPVIVRWPK